MICTEQEILEFLEVSGAYSIITAANNSLVMKYDGGTAAAISISDGTYTPDSLASAFQSAIDTALSCSSTVSYSTSTKKFTFSVGAGHTLEYVHTGSTAASVVGFTESHSAALSITSDQVATDPTSIVSVIQTMVEKWISKRCKRTFESTTYLNERYDGSGNEYLFLKNYPVISLYRLSVGTRDVIRVSNSQNNTMATVSVNSTGVVLVRDDSVDSTLLFSSYATLNDLVTAINAVGNGWSGTVASFSLYGSYKTTHLLPIFGAWCNYGSSVYLKMPEEGVDDLELDEKAGIVRRTAGYFPKGLNNVILYYTAGYSSDDMPDLLKSAVKIFAKAIYNKYMEQAWSLKRYQIGDNDIVKDYLDTNGIPVEVTDIVNYFRRVLI